MMPTGEIGHGSAPAAAVPAWLGITPRNWQVMIAAVATITVFGLALGLMFPLLALLMERAAVPPDVIGYNTAMQPLGILFSGVVVPPLVARFGARGVVIAASTVASMLVISYPFLPIFWAWFAVRFLQGVAVSTLFSISEAWLVEAAEGPYRSRLVAAYSTVLAFSFGGGPALIAVTGIDGVLPFAVGAMVLLAAAIPVALMRDLPSHVSHAGPAVAGEQALGLFGYVKTAPVLLLAVCVFGMFDAAVLGFLPVYGVAMGLPEATAALLLSVLVFGNIGLQIPIGWLADKLDKRAIMAVCALITAVGAAAVPSLMGTAVVWVVLLVIGATSGGIYTVALAEVGDRFKGQALVGATAAMATMWGLGALIGALGTGWAMRVFGPHGLPWTLVAVMVLFLLAIAVRQHWKARAAGAAG